MVPSMLRPMVVVLVLCAATPVLAADKADIVTPSAAVAAAWAKEGKQATSTKALRVLYGSYGALQTLDMVSTIKARQQGAREVNPMMSGSYGQATATKVLLAAAATAGVMVIERKNKKAAFVTMIALNVATAAIVASNYRNARQLAQR
jgi:hypothetical protein